MQAKGIRSTYDLLLVYDLGILGVGDSCVWWLGLRGPYRKVRDQGFEARG